MLSENYNIDEMLLLVFTGEISKCMILWQIINDAEYIGFGSYSLIGIFIKSVAYFCILPIFL